MYLSTSQALGQAELPSAYGKPCLQDDVIGRLFTLPVDTLSKNLDGFVFRSSALRTWHKVWIKQQFVPAIVASWRTDKPIQTIVLVGDADEIGEPAPNYKLGKARAEEVGKELTKQIELKSPGLSSKITIEVHSRGECWPVVKSGKKEARNRRVSVFGVRKALATTGKPTQQPPTTQKGPNIRDIPEKIKPELEEKDRAELERRKYDPLPVLPPGKSLRDWLNERLRRVPKWLRDPIVDGVVSGTCAGLASALDEAGLGEGVKEGLKAVCKAVAQGKVR
jgi:hypothetical protein